MGWFGSVYYTELGRSGAYAGFFTAVSDRPSYRRSRERLASSLPFGPPSTRLWPGYRVK